jgi:hypothetical protein
MGLPELEVVADDPDPSPLETGTNDVDPPVMVPELIPLPEPELGKLEPLHPVLVVTVCPPTGVAGFTWTAPTKGVASPPPTGFGGCTSVAPPTGTKGAKVVTPRARLSTQEYAVEY